jgi:hypothetical protein
VDRWKKLERGEEVLSCTMIVSSASAWVEPYHDHLGAVRFADVSRFGAAPSSISALYPELEFGVFDAVTEIAVVISC